jgi:murein DD-endopeptidase MepM/ murein hydrolase activator NlpD
MRALSTAVAAAVVGLGIAFGGSASDPSPAAAQAVDGRLEHARERLRVTRERERVLTDEVQAYGERIQALEARLAPLRARSEALRRELDALRVRLADLTRGLAAERIRLAEARATLARRQALLSRRLRELYARGEPDPLLVLVESGDLSSAIETVDLLAGIADRDAGLANAVSRFADETRRRRDQIAETRADVARSEARAEAAADEALAARTALEGQQTGLEDLLGARRVLLAGVQGDRREIEVETRNLEARSSRLAATIRTAQEPAGGAPGPAPTPAPGPSPAPAPSAGSGFIWPARGTLTSTYGPRWGRMHEGIDIAGPSGSPIVAAAGGTVIVAGWSGGYGNLVVVDHGGGISTAYAHNSSIAVSVGQSIGQGTVLAGMGTTGNSTGVHSHFEVRVNGAAVNPLGYL